MPDWDDVKKFVDDHDEKVDDALEKVGDAAGAKFGHGAEIDKGVDWVQEHTGDGDSQEPSPA